jgi:hypothetical protein
MRIKDRIALDMFVKSKNLFSDYLSGTREALLKKISKHLTLS